MSFLVLPDTIPHLKEDASNWATFAARFQEAMLAMHHWGHFDGTQACPTPKDAANPTFAERQATKEWQRQDVVVRGHLSPRLPDQIFIQLINHKTAKGRWDRLIEVFGQPGYEDTDKGLTREVPAQTTDAELEATSGEPGTIEEVAHAHDDRAEPDLQMEQPGDLNVNTPEGVTHSELDSMLEETDLNASAHLEGAGPEILMGAEEDRSLEVEEDGTAGKTVSVEGDMDPRVGLREPGVSCLATQEVAGSLTMSSPPPPTTPEAASTQRSLAVDTETPAIPVPEHGADLEPQPHDTLPPPNEGAEPPIYQPPEQVRAPTKVEGPLPGEESQRATGQRGPTLARTHEGMTPIGEAHGRPPDLPNPQMQGSIVWEPAFTAPKAQVRTHQARRPLLDMGACTRPDPWPDQGAVIVDPDTCIGSASQLEGEQNIDLPCVWSELHAAPPAPQHFQSSFSPSPPVLLPLDTLTRKNPPRGEGAATEQRAIDDCPRPKPSKLSDTHGKGLQEAGGVPSVLDNSPAFPENPDPFGLPGADKKADVGGVEPSRIDAYERGGAPLLMGAAPALVKDTVGVGPADEAETASAAKPEALVSWAQEAGRGREVNAQPYEALLQKGERNAGALSRKRKRRPTEGEREPVRLPGEAPQNHKGTLEMPPRNHERERGATPQGVAKRKVERLPREGKRKLERPEAVPPDGERERGTMPQGTPNEGICKPGWPPQEPAHEAVPTTSEGQGPWDPGGRPPRERTLDSKRPVEAMDIVPGIVAHNKTTWRASTPARKQKTPGRPKNQSEGGTFRNKQLRTWGPYPYPLIHRPGLLSSRSSFVFISRPIERALRRPGSVEAETPTATRPFGGRHIRVTFESHAVTRVPAPCTLWCTGRETPTRGHRR